MQSSLNNALHRLLSVIDGIGHGPAKAVIRTGRFACLSDGHTSLDDAFPASAVEIVDNVVLASAAPLALQDLPSMMSEPDIQLWPVKGASQQTLALLCVPIRSVSKTAAGVIASAAETLGVLIETLDTAAAQSARALHDPLTHLPNRAMFTERMLEELAVAQRAGSRVGVLTVDLDGFSALNKQHGQEFGDRLLQRIAARLHHAVRRTDLLARLNEDEFGLLYCGLGDQLEGAHVANRLLRVINQPLELDGVTITPTASVGIGVFPHDGSDVEALMHHSNVAMHRAKIRGLNQFEYFTPQMNADAMERLELEGRLRLAVARNEMRLHFQPIVDMQHRITAVEALVRWQHPEQGLVSPAKFIPIAEQTGLIVPIGTWVLRQSCEQAAAWAAQGHTLRMNVNVSTLQICKDDFVPLVLTTLRETGLEPSLLELELTEGAFANDDCDVATKLHQLRAAGVRVAIDDFGAGHSSLARVHSLPVDTIKIDRAFINQISNKDRSTPLQRRTAVLRAMATLGQSLRIRLVAEGVEDQTQARFLKRAGYNALQGFLFSKPVTADLIVGLVEASGVGIQAVPLRTRRKAA
ncbi:MAG TPA: EAL domain-containing protein [Tepidisphaeraceae bacterium]